MKPFVFQKFNILQQHNVFRIGTDAVLLGALAHVHFANTILEVGTGTGIISLMLAQRNSFANILSIDIDDNAVALARENFSSSIFNERLSVKKEDFNFFDSAIKFDSIVSNPPFFEENSSTKDIFARQQIALSYENLISKSTLLLSDEGRLSVIIPSDDEDMFTNTAEKYQFFTVRKVNIFGRANLQRKRVVLELCLNKKELVIEDLVIEKSPRKYSDDYLELTKDFHVFGKK